MVQTSTRFAHNANFLVVTPTGEKLTFLRKQPAGVHLAIGGGTSFRGGYVEVDTDELKIPAREIS